MKNLSISVFFISLCLFASLASGEEPETKAPSPKKEYDYYDYSDPLLTTEYITIEGEPVRLEDGIDLRGEDLKRTRINNITLSNIDFSGADLSFADLSQTRFFHCNFQ